MSGEVTIRSIDKGESLEVTVGYGEHTIFLDSIGLYGEFFPKTLNAVIHRIFVPDEDQGQGYGQKMLAAFENEMRQKGCKSLKLGLVKNLNQRDLEFLKKAGFTCIDAANAIYEKQL